MRIILTFIIILLFSKNVLADEIYLNNGDKITGNILEETATHMMIETQAMGRISVVKGYVSRKVTDEQLALETQQKKQEERQWKGKVSFGYSDTGGNTDKSQGSFDVKANRKTDKDEWIAKYSAYISTSNNKTDARKFYGMLRYAYSFGEELKWYHFYKLEGSQDRFANVDSRITPSSGLGYWFADEEDYKAMVEMALGFEHTSYVDNSKDDNELVLVPRGYLEKVLVGNLRLSEDLTLYPSLGDFGEFRLRSETSMINPINDRLSWRISFIDDYDSDPQGETENNDYRIVSALDFNF